MFQLGFGLISDSSEPSWWMNILRTVFSTIDTVVYTLISYIYQVLFAIANSTIISPALIRELYGRVQLILGVVMIFKLATSILQVIINPDLLNDPKKGTGKIISKILIMLVLFVSIIPLNIQGNLKKGSYNEYINNNGILFGTLYSLQKRILSNNTLERIVFGSSEMSNGETIIDSEESGSRMAAYVLRGFVRPNLKQNKKNLKNKNNYICSPDDKITNDSKTLINTVTTVGGGLLGAKVGSAAGAAVGSVVPGLGTAIGAAAGVIIGGATGFAINAVKEFVTGEKIGAVYTIYSSTSASATNILEFINIQCDDGYAFSYLPIISSICGIILLISLIGSCISIAIRSIKLAVLRLIAPIPIISYIDPKSSENGMFANWVKILSSTYLDLFMRLIVIYFVIYIVTAIVDGNLNLGFENGAGGIIATIFVIVGLFKFLDEAPKFIGEALGIKGLSSGILSGVLGGTSALLGGAGIKGALAAGMSTAQATNAAAAQGKAAPPAWQAGSDLAAQIKTGDPKARGGVMNAINDRLMRDAGINVARKKYGVTAQGLDIANEKMHKDQDAADKEKDLYDRFNRGQVSEDEMNAWAARNNVAYDSSSGTITDSDGNVKTAREAIYDSANNLSIKAAKSKKNYEEAKKFADSHRVTPSFEEEHRASLRERIPKFKSTRLKERPDMFNDIGEGATSHQRLADRIRGSRENWSDSESDRTDNRWSPGTTRSGNENAIHDNPDRNIDTPQAGPPPGGPHP